MSKSEKLYKNSPSIKRDEKDGSMKVEKPSKVDGQDMGTEGNPLPGSDGKMPIEVKQSVGDAMAEMHGRHQNELKDMHKRHQDDFKTLEKKTSSKEDAEKTGKSLIEKTESDKKE